MRLKVSIANLTKDLNKYLSQKFRFAIIAAKEDIFRDISRYLVRDIIYSYAETQLLINGGATEEEDYEAHFGLDASVTIEEAMNEVFNTLMTQTEFDFISIDKSTIKSKIVFRFIDADFEEVCALDGSHYVSEISGSSIQWLRWILLEGDTTIDNFGINFNISEHEAIRSRSGRALMVKLTKKDKSKSLAGEFVEQWVVPSPFTGSTYKDNFITRALKGARPKVIEKIIMKHFIRELGKRLSGDN